MTEQSYEQKAPPLDAFSMGARNQKLYRTLQAKGLYVWPVYLNPNNVKADEIDHFIVSVSRPTLKPYEDQLSSYPG